MFERGLSKYSQSTPKTRLLTYSPSLWHKMTSNVIVALTAMSRSYLFISNLHRSLVTSSHSIRRMIHSRPQRSSRTALATLSLCSLLLGGAQGVCSNATGDAVNVPMALAAANFSHPGLSLVRHALQTSGRPRPRLDVHPPQRTAAAAENIRRHRRNHNMGAPPDPSSSPLYISSRRRPPRSRHGVKPRL